MFQWLDHSDLRVLGRGNPTVRVHEVESDSIYRVLLSDYDSITRFEAQEMDLTRAIKSLRLGIVANVEDPSFHRSNDGEL